MWTQKTPASHTLLSRDTLPGFKLRRFGRCDSRPLATPIVPLPLNRYHGVVAGPRRPAIQLERGARRIPTYGCLGVNIRWPYRRVAGVFTLGHLRHRAFLPRSRLHAGAQARLPELQR